MKAKILTFVRGLKNGTPPRFQSYLKSLILLGFLTFGISQALGETVEIYTNSGSTGKDATSGINAAGNINTSNVNGNPAPAFGLTSASNKTITLSECNFSNYTNISLSLDWKPGKSGSTYTKLTLSQYDKDNKLIGSTISITASTTSYTSKTGIALSSDCKKITIVCYPAGSAYNTYVDNIKITGEPAAADPSIEAEDELLLDPEEAYGTFEVKWTAMEEVDVALYTDFACTNKITGVYWFDVELDDDNNVYYVASANTGKTSRTVYMQLYGIDADVNEYTKVVTVTQSGAGDGDKITCSKVGVCGSSSYSDWKNDFNGVSGAVYKGSSAGSNNSIQLRSSDDPSGIVSTTSGGIISKVKVEWESHTASGRVLNIYGSHDPYTSVADLRDDDKQGTLLGTITNGTSTELSINTDEFEYVGVCSNASAMYLTSITFVWETPVLNVSFDLNGGTGDKPTKIIEFPTSLPSTTDFTKVGYRPNGWNTQADGKGTHYNDGASFSAPAESVKLYVEWVKVYSVTYKGNYATGGVAPEDAALHDENSDVTVLDNTGNLYKTGYTWSGWNTNNSGTGTDHAAGSTFKITANTDLYAKWVAKQTTVTLSQGVVTTEGTKEIIATYGQAMPTTDVTMPSRTGYDFKGYYDDETEGTQYYYSTGNSAKNWNKEDATATLFARWQVQVYDITYRDQNDGAFHGTWPTPDTHPTKHTYGIETSLVNPTRMGYDFGGWFEDQACATTPVSTIAGDAKLAKFTLYAKWIAKDYELTFYKNSEQAGGSMANQAFKFDEQKALSKNEFSAPEHKHFTGWAETATGAKKYDDEASYKMTSEGAELFAVWDWNQTEITLDKQGGSGGNNKVTATYGSAMPSAGSVPNKTGYDFNGYYTEENGQGKQYYSSTNASVQNWDKDDATLTLYAYWTPKTITITLNKGAHGQANGTATFVYNTKAYKDFTPVQPTTGYKLDGYYTTAAGGSMVLDAEGKLGGALNNWIDAEGNWIRSSNDELHAHYTPINYSVTWLVNGTEWTGKGGSTEAAYDSKIAAVPTTLPTTSECDDEKVFMGWTAIENYSNATEAPSDLFTKAADAPTITGETKYYAVFAKAEGATYAYELVTTPTSGKKYIFVSSNTAGSAYAMTAKDLSTSTNSGVTASAVAVTIANTTPVTITDENTDLEYAYDGSKFQIVNNNTYYLFINGNGISKRSNENRAYWDNTNGLYGASNSGTTTYYLYLKEESGTYSFDKSSSASTRVYAFEKQSTTYSAYATECEAEQPVITTQPQGGQYIEGNPIFPLSVVATPANRVTYQWQKSDNATDGFTDIEGATSSSYAPDNTILGTTYYRCVVTNRDKSVTSNAVSVQITAQTTCATPSFSITDGGNAFIRETKVTMTTTTDGADIYYTLDGSTPSTTSAKYTEPVKITATTTVKAIAAKTNMTNSSVGSATFTKATLQSIAVKTAPTTTTYTALTKFDPAGLVITASYDYSLSEEVTYANHESEFSFEPNTSTPLNVTNNTVNITWEQKSTTQAIIVNPIAVTAPEPTQTACNFTSVTIAWAAVANADHYEIAWNGGDYVTATSPYVKTDLTYSSNYTYKVKVVGLTNYGTAETATLNASTQTREVASIKNVVAPTKTYYVGDQVKNTDITCTIVYNNEDEEQGNPQFVGFASNPTSATTAALTDAQVGTTTIYVKSANTELTTTITVEETPKHMFVDRVNGNTTIVKEGQGTIYDVPALIGVVEACTYAPNNNVFKGWIDSEFTGDVITDADLLQETKLTIAGGKTFYAVWAEHKVEDVDGIASSTNLSTANAILETGKPINYTSSASYFNPLRIYQNTTITISATTGTYITSVKFDCASGYDATDFTATPTSQSTEGTIYDWAGNANSIAFKATSQVRLDGITVKYYQTVEKDVNYISDCVAMCELSFDANGGTGTAPEAILLKEGGKVNLPNATLTKAYNDFFGWNTAADGKGTHYDVADEYTMGAEEAVLYADWAPRAVESLEITTPATTLEFGIGQTFSSEGLKVKANYIGGETEADVAFTTNYDNHIFTADEEGQPTVTISYKGATTTYNILVAPALIVRFFVNGTQIQEKSVFDKKIGAMPNAMTSGAWTDPENAFIASHYPIFAGWTLATSDDAIEFINEGTGITTNVDVNAVFAKSATPDLDNKTLATSIDPSKRYVIVDGENYYSGEASDNDWGVVDAEYAEIITFYGKSGVYAIQQADGNYINTPKVNAKDESDHKFYLSAEPVHSFNMVMVTKDNVDYYGLQATNTEEYLRNNSNNANCLRWYNTSIPAQLYSVDVTYDHLTIAPKGDHVRTGLTFDQAGTICLPYAVKADDYKGASVWSIENKTGTSTMIMSITLAKEVEDDGITKKDLEAGKPYIFFAEESEFQLFYSGEEYKLEENDGQTVFANGLFGNLDVNPIIINPTEYIPGTYLISQNKLMECGKDCNVPQYRAYVKADDIQYIVQAPINAPRRYIGNPNGTPTNLNGLNGNMKAQKALIDGHIYILRDNKMYNAQGLFVK